MLKVPDHARTPWLTEAELNPTRLHTSDGLASAIRAFQADSDLRLLPILDQHDRPVGAIFEREVRRLLLNPFGHALLQNPTFGGDIRPHIRRCPVHELTSDIAVLIAAYHSEDGREGMILTKSGKLFATLSNRRLLMLAAEEEHRATERRLRRAERIEWAGLRFEQQAAQSTSQMIALSDAVQRLAEASIDRFDIAVQQASSAAGAAMQTRDNMARLANFGNGLAAAFTQIESTVAANSAAAGQAAEQVGIGAARARSLLEAARSIDDVTETVRNIAGNVNLLSLNASIEAARAGSTGQGFAVVAREIRSLSDRTKSAAETISKTIATVQVGIGNAVKGYDRVEGAITCIADGAREIDQAVSMEAGTTRMIATSVAEASAASATIEGAVSVIASSVRSASASARELHKLAGTLRTGANLLGGSVEELLKELREAA